MAGSWGNAAVRTGPEKPGDNAKKERQFGWWGGGNLGSPSVTTATAASEEAAAMVSQRLTGYMERRERLRSGPGRRFRSEWNNEAVLAESRSSSSSSSSSSLNLHHHTWSEKEEPMKRCVECSDPVSS